MRQFSKMWSLWVITSALCVLFSTIYADDYGQGIWDPTSIEKCEEADHKFKYYLQVEDYNSTHTIINGHIVSEVTFTKEFGIRIEIYKCAGDDCKPMHMLRDDCLIDFLNTYIEEDVKGLLIAGGVDPPEVPIEKGDYHVTNYMFAKKQTLGVYGSFFIKSFVLEGDKDNEVGCIGIKVQFNKLED